MVCGLNCFGYCLDVGCDVYCCVCLVDLVLLCCGLLCLMWITLGFAGLSVFVLNCVNSVGITCALYVVLRVRLVLFVLCLFVCDFVWCFLVLIAAWVSC